MLKWIVNIWNIIKNNVDLINFYVHKPWEKFILHTFRKFPERNLLNILYQVLLWAYKGIKNVAYLKKHLHKIYMITHSYLKTKTQTLSVHTKAFILYASFNLVSKHYHIRLIWFLLQATSSMKSIWLFPSFCYSVSFSIFKFLILFLLVHVSSLFLSSSLYTTICSKEHKGINQRVKSTWKDILAVT